MQREILKPQFDTPMVVKLDFGPEGIQRDGKFGIDYQYTVNDDACVMWLPPIGRDALVQSGAQAGDTVAITKSKRGTQTFFAAQIVGDAVEEAEPAAPPARIAPRHSVSSARANGPNVGQRAYYQPAAPAGPQRVSAPTTQPATAAQPASSAAQLAAAFYAALDAAAAAEEYASEKYEMALNLDSEDIRAMAISIFIGAQRGGRS